VTKFVIGLIVGLILTYGLIYSFNNNVFGSPWIPIGAVTLLFVGVVAYFENKHKKLNKGENQDEK
jgi:hypothetical protein